MLVPHGALVLVVDGAHVQLLRNRGRDVSPDLEAVPSERLRHCEHGADAGHGDRRIREVVAALDPLIAGEVPLILIAPPASLGALRQALPRDAQRRVVAEIAKDLSHCPPHELADRLHRTPA
jgi:protein required for attachment to host cells